MLRLDWRHGKLFYGDIPLDVSDELEAARVLLKRNLAKRSDEFATYRGDTPCLKAGIGWAADRRVTSHRDGYPIFVRLKDSRKPLGGDEMPSTGLGGLEVAKRLSVRCTAAI